MANLKVVLTEWILQSYRDPSVVLEASAIKAVIPGRLSPRTDMDLILRNRRWDGNLAGAAVPFFLLFLMGLGLLVPMWRRKLRGVRALSASCAALFTCGILCSLFSYYDDWTLGGGKDYFDEYAYATGVAFCSRSSVPSDVIIAYELKTWGGEWRVVGFGDGHVRKIREDRFQELLKAQGMTFAKPE